MCHQNDRTTTAWDGVQILCQPTHCFHIKMVRRFVQQQHIPRSNQGRGQRDPARFTTREALGRRIKSGGQQRRGDPAEQSCQYRSDIRIRSPLMIGAITYDGRAHSCPWQSVMLTNHHHAGVTRHGHPTRISLPTS